MAMNSGKLYTGVARRGAHAPATAASASALSSSSLLWSSLLSLCSPPQQAYSASPNTASRTWLKPKSSGGGWLKPSEVGAIVLPAHSRETPVVQLVVQRVALSLGCHCGGGLGRLLLSPQLLWPRRLRRRCRRHPRPLDLLARSPEAVRAASARSAQLPPLDPVHQSHSSQNQPSIGLIVSVRQMKQSSSHARSHDIRKTSVHHDATGGRHCDSLHSVALHTSRHRLDLRWQVRLHHEFVPGVAEGAGVGRREAKRGTRAH